MICIFPIIYQINSLNDLYFCNYVSNKNRSFALRTYVSLLSSLAHTFEMQLENCCKIWRRTKTFHTNKKSECNGSEDGTTNKTNHMWMHHYNLHLNMKMIWTSIVIKRECNFFFSTVNCKDEKRTHQTLMFWLTMNLFVMLQQSVNLGVLENCINHVKLCDNNR